MRRPHRYIDISHFRAPYKEAMLSFGAAPVARTSSTDPMVRVQLRPAPTLAPKRITAPRRPEPEGLPPVPVSCPEGSYFDAESGLCLRRETFNFYPPEVEDDQGISCPSGQVWSEAAQDCVSDVSGGKPPSSSTVLLVAGVTAAAIIGYMYFAR